MAENLVPARGIRNRNTQPPARELVNTGIVNEPVAPVIIQSKLTMEQQRERDKQLVKGVFRFHEVPGGR